MADTILLDVDTWDLVLDRSGNIALASSVDPADPAFSEAYGQAQDAASQIRLFLGELDLDTTQGIPYWQQILGYLPSTQLMIAKFEQAALLVLGVERASCVISSVRDRTVEGTVTITNTSGASATAQLIFG